MIKRALISVSDKTGVVDFAAELASLGIEILSTGGTAKAIREAGIPVKDVSEHTGFPEMMGGRIKTLHPKVHGGILARRNDEGDMKDMEAHGIEPIDMVVVNLYPFEKTVAKPDVTLEEAIENIDIGGPTMLRAAAKNHRDVVVVVDPKDYEVIVAIILADGDIDLETRFELARKVFAHTSAYDGAITAYLEKCCEQPGGNSYEGTEEPVAVGSEPTGGEEINII